MAEHDFTQILYFTSEQDAQRFEPEPLTDADEPAQAERRGLMTNLRSFDLRAPQMLVPPRPSGSAMMRRAASRAAFRTRSSRFLSLGLRCEMPRKLITTEVTEVQTYMKHRAFPPCPLCPPWWRA